MYLLIIVLCTPVFRLFTLNVSYFQDTCFHQLLKTAELFQWDLVEPASYESAVTWVPGHYDARCVLVDGTSGMSPLLRLVHLCFHRLIKHVVCLFSSEQHNNGYPKINCGSSSG